MDKLVLETVQFKNLIDIDDVEPVNDEDSTVLNELRDVLIKHNCTERFGVTLLHKHFEVEEGEMLLERTDEENRTSVVKVEKVADFPSSTVGTMWKFNKSDTQTSMVCVIKCEYDYRQGYHARRHRNE